MYSFLLTSLFIIIPSFCNAQGNLFLNIKKIYDEGKYEKCLKKSSSLLKKEINKKEPALHLYKSMSLFKLSQEEYNSKYPKALKSSLKSANKAKVKDTNDKFISKYHSFIERLQQTTHKIAFHQYEEEGEYSLAKSYYNELVDLCNDTLALYMSGKCDVLNERETEGYRSISKAVEANHAHYLKTKAKTATSYIMPAFYDMVSYLLEKAVIDSAYKTIIKAIDIFHDEDSIKQLYFEVLKNYKTYYAHYNQPELMLKKIIKAGNQYPNDHKILQLEEELIIDLTEDMISKAQFKYLEKLNSQYTNRKRNGNIKIKLSKTNFNLIKILTDLHHQKSYEVCSQLIMSIKRINENINNQLKASNDSLIYPKGYGLNSFVSDIMNDLNFKNEFYRSLIFYKYISLFSYEDNASENKQKAEELASTTRQSLNNHINKLYTARKNLMSGKVTGKRREQEFIYVIEGYLQIFDFNQLYPVLKLSSKEHSENAALNKLFRSAVIEDFKLNYYGSQLHIRNKDDKWYSDLDWKGNAKKCRIGDVSSLAYDKAEQRVNYFRRLSGCNEKIKIERNNNALAMKIALQKHPEVKRSCDSTQYIIIQKHFISDESLIDGVTDALKYFDTEKKEIPGFELFLDPKRKSIICASTDKTSVFMESTEEVLSSDNIENEPVCWPPEGYIPSKLVYNTWGFSLVNTDLSKAIVKMECMGKEIVVDKIIKPTKSKGRNTISWKPSGVIKYAEIDLPYKVSIYNTYPEGKTKPVKYEYTVNIIQP